MNTYIVSLGLIGFIGLCVSWFPAIVARLQISYSIVFVGLGFFLYSITDILPLPSPYRDEHLTVRLTELIVIIALMGTGLKIDRAFGLRKWHVPFRLLIVAMILSIASLTFLGAWLLGLQLASALLLAAALAPTDPVLASDVQVDAPNEGKDDITRFALTAEAGMNDGMAFPFVWMAIAVAIATQTGEPWLAKWLAYDVLYRILAGVGVGFLLGRAVSYVFFRLPEQHDMLHVRDGMVAICATLLIYAVTELAHGYGFIAVFVAAVTIRNWELKHAYHTTLHGFTDQVERVLLAVILVLFGGSLATGIMEPLTWKMALLGLVFVLILRPASAWVALGGSSLPVPHRLAISFFGIRGIGSLFYLSFGLNHAKFFHEEELWALTAFIVLVSIILHGLTAPRIIHAIRNGKHGPAE